MISTPANPLVHIELHTDNLPRACASYTRLFGWSTNMIRAASGCYLALDLGAAIGGGVVESESEHPMWLPYVEVTDVAECTDRARALGASVSLEPREGPAGWRSVIAVPAGAQVALWQTKSKSPGKEPG